MFRFGFNGARKLGAAFLDVTGATPDIDYVSNKIIPTEAGAVTITGGTFSINNAAYGTTGSVTAGDKLRVKVTSSASYSTAVNVVVSIDAVEYDTYTVTTMAEPTSGESVTLEGGTIVWHTEDGTTEVTTEN